MSRESLINRGRRRAEDSFHDQCTIRRRTGTTTGPGGVITPVWASVFSGDCRIQIGITGGQGTEKTVGQAVVLVGRRELQLPISAPEILEGDQVTITAAAYDPALVGTVYVARDIPVKSESTARRITVIEVTS